MTPVSNDPGPPDPAYETAHDIKERLGFEGLLQQLGPPPEPPKQEGSPMTDDDLIGFLRSVRQEAEDAEEPSLEPFRPTRQAGSMPGKAEPPILPAPRPNGPIVSFDPATGTLTLQRAANASQAPTKPEPSGMDEEATSSVVEPQPAPDQASAAGSTAGGTAAAWPPSLSEYANPASRFYDPHLQSTDKELGFLPLLDQDARGLLEKPHIGPFPNPFLPGPYRAFVEQYGMIGLRAATSLRAVQTYETVAPDAPAPTSPRPLDPAKVGKPVDINLNAADNLVVQMLAALGGGRGAAIAAGAAGSIVSKVETPFISEGTVRPMQVIKNAIPLAFSQPREEMMAHNPEIGLLIPPEAGKFLWEQTTGPGTLAKPVDSRWDTMGADFLLKLHAIKEVVQIVTGKTFTPSFDTVQDVLKVTVSSPENLLAGGVVKDARSPSGYSLNVKHDPARDVYILQGDLATEVSEARELKVKLLGQGLKLGVTDYPGPRAGFGVLKAGTEISAADFGRLEFCVRYPTIKKPAGKADVAGNEQLVAEFKDQKKIGSLAGTGKSDLFGSVQFAPSTVRDASGHGSSLPSARRVELVLEGSVGVGPFGVFGSVGARVDFSLLRLAHDLVARRMELGSGFEVVRDEAVNQKAMPFASAWAELVIQPPPHRPGAQSVQVKVPQAITPALANAKAWLSGSEEQMGWFLGQMDHALGQLRSDPAVSAFRTGKLEDAIRAARFLFVRHPPERHVQPAQREAVVAILDAFAKAKWDAQQPAK